MKREHLKLKIVLNFFNFILEVRESLNCNNDGRLQHVNAVV